jgi:hypothetical protein
MTVCVCASAPVASNPATTQTAERTCLVLFTPWLEIVPVLAFADVRVMLFAELQYSETG